METYRVSGHDIALKLSDSVFQPTSTTKKMADHLEIPENSDVLDLGCGSGPLAILAARMGARHVYATDVMEEACELARDNVKQNGLTDKVSVLCGSLFEPVKGKKFDVIIDDVSGVADYVARVSPWFPPPIPTGGEDGTELVTEVITQARDYLNPGGTLYFPVIGLSAAQRIINHAHEVFDNTAECVGSYQFPFCKELVDEMDEMEKLRERGIIEFEKLGSRFVWKLEVWRCQLKSD